MRFTCRSIPRVFGCTTLAAAVQGAKRLGACRSANAGLGRVDCRNGGSHAVGVFVWRFNGQSKPSRAICLAEFSRSQAGCFNGWSKRRCLVARGANLVARHARLRAHQQRARDHGSRRACGLQTRWLAGTGCVDGRFEGVLVRTTSRIESSAKHLGGTHVCRSTRGWQSRQLRCRCQSATHRWTRPRTPRRGHCRPFASRSEIDFLPDEFAGSQVRSSSHLRRNSRRVRARNIELGNGQRFGSQ